MTFGLRAYHVYDPTLESIKPCEMQVNRASVSGVESALLLEVTFSASCGLAPRLSLTMPNYSVHL